MNLLLHPDPVICQELLGALGTAASLSAVDDDGGFSLIAMNDLCRAYFDMKPLSGITRLNIDNVRELMGSSIPQTEAYLDRLLGNYRHVVNSGTQLSTETDLVTPLGETRWSRNALTPILDNGKVARLMVTFVDVTEIRQIQRQREDSLRSLVSGLIRYCDGCQQVEDGSGTWLKIGDYMRRQTEREFTHGICESCLVRMEQEDG
jgi:hypothetical protein